MNKKEQKQFIYQCLVLLEAGISLSEALNMVAQIYKKQKMKGRILQIKGGIERGLPLSKSLHLVIPSFVPTLLTLIQIGEGGGILTITMRQGIEIIDKSEYIKRKLLGALVYPCFIGVATIGMTLFLVLYIFPKIIPLFSSMNIELPLLTRLVKYVYETIAAYGIYSFLILIPIFTLTVLLYFKNHKVKLSVQKLFIKSPLIGNVFKKYYIANTFRMFKTLLENGQTLPRILEQAILTNQLLLYSLIWKDCKNQIQNGVALSVAIQKYTKEFPEIVSSMILIGEKSGSLVHMFANITKIYEEDLDNFIKQLSTLIEPVLMVFMGVVVGSIALSIILPVYEITNHLQH